MHGVIPVLFVIAVEAARHAIGRIAEIVADKHIEGPNPSRWFLNPVGTFILWRRQRLWAIRAWETVLHLEQERRIYVAQLRKEHGRRWRRKATAEQLLVLSLAKDGMSITEAIELPAREEAKRREEAARIERERQHAEDERRRQEEADRIERERKALELEQARQRAEDERRRQLEQERLEREAKELELARAREAAERQRLIEEARAQAELAEIQRQQRIAEAEQERRQRQEQLDYARRIAEEQQRAADAARLRRENEEAAARAAAAKEAASRRAAEIVQRAATASQAPANRAATASHPTASRSANAATTPPANTPAVSASTTSTASASTPATTPATASATANQAPTSSASAIDIQQVVDVYQLLKEQDGKAPSDAKLGQALGVSRSRAQQLRTAAIDAGHTELAKPMRLAS
jgi:hypothetical protein